MAHFALTAWRAEGQRTTAVPSVTAAWSRWQAEPYTCNTGPPAQAVAVVTEVMHVHAELADSLLQFLLPRSHILYEHGSLSVCESYLCCA